ncbi:MAG: transcription termination factor NusA [Clostridia bacterium]|nr:transcription termination factor NusA [Clostridia bacterium]
MDIKELYEALGALEKEKGISKEFMLVQIEKAIGIACKNSYGGNDDMVVNFNDDSVEVRLNKTVVEEVVDSNREIALSDARVIDANTQLGEKVGVSLDPMEFGRIAVQTARSIIRQGIRDGERGRMYQDFLVHNHELVTASIERIDPKSGNYALKFGKADIVLPKSEQIGNENVREGDNIKFYIVDVKDSERGPRVIISRKHADFVKSLFVNEVPEIQDGTIEIKSVSREAGSRTKLAVFSKDANVDSVGSCIGPRGGRVNAIVDELGGEKIDIIEYSDDPVKFVSAALAPADVIEVNIIDELEKTCKVTVPDSQLSLAIGNKGQNVRLAARLTGWKIDIRPESGFFGEDIEESSDNDSENEEIV